GTGRDRQLARSRRRLPRLRASLEEECAGRADHRLGLRKLCLHHAALREAPATAGWDFGRGQPHELVDRRARDAERDRRAAEREQTEDREAVERSLLARAIRDDRRRATGRNEQVVYLQIVAPRAAQARHVPGIDDL